MVLTLCLCVVYGSRNKPQRLPYTTLTDLFCKTEVDSVYWAVRTHSLYKTDTFPPKTCKKRDLPSAHDLYISQYVLNSSLKMATRRSKRVAS
jgi:hypothetical protein